MTFASLAAVVADTAHTIASHVEREQPLGVYLSLIGMGLTIAGIIYKGGVMIGDMRATRREHHTRIENLERAAEAAAVERITRQELDARFSKIDAQLTALNTRLSDAITLFSEAKR